MPAPDRLVTHYDALLHDGRTELQRILGWLGIPADAQSLEEARRAINLTLRHHRASFDGASGSTAYPEVRELYSTLCNEAGPTLRAAHEAASSQAKTQELAVAEEERAGGAESKAEQLLDDLRGRVMRSSFTVKSLEQTIEGQKRQLDAQKQHIDSQSQGMAQLTAHRDMLEAKYLELQSSMAVKILGRYRGLVERLLPEFTWRRRLYNGLVTVVRHLLLDGPLYILRSAWQRLAALRSVAARRSQARTQVASGQGSSPPIRRTSGDKYAWAFEELMLVAANASDRDFVQPVAESLDASSLPIKAIAFYLPQFHPVPENDEWWGKGFTEWTNVTKAVPQFVGHYQPRLPGELGFYDLRLPEILARQVGLARKYGIHGFAFHYYWFNGKRLLERPLDNFLADASIDFPFCICWANENWTRRWDGQENEILIAQAHSPESDRRFIRDVTPILQDKRYIRVDGRPLLIVYRPDALPEASRTVQLWRDHCQKSGLGNPFLVAAQTFGFTDPRPIGFDAAVEFPPHTKLPLMHLTWNLEMLNTRYAGAVVDYSAFVDKALLPTNPPYELFKTVFPSWDNEARKPGRGFVFAFSTPAEYQRWLAGACEQTLAQEQDPDRRLVFINAWNEWGEGAYLEPDRRFGYGYLKATMDALRGLEHRDPDGQPREESRANASRGPDPVIVYQMGKVGSMSVVDSLKHAYAELSLPVQVHHVHMLNNLDNIESQEVRARVNPADTLAAMQGYRALRAEIDADLTRRWTVITLVREPVGRNIAWFFQNLHELIPDWEERMRAKTLGLKELQELFLQSPRVKHAVPEVWFRNQLQPVFDVDVFAEPFPTEIGYKIYRQSTRSSLLLIRVENLTDCASLAMKEFLGLDRFVLVNSNVAADKSYAPFYDAFRKLLLPGTYLKEMYGTRFCAALLQ